MPTRAGRHAKRLCDAVHQHRSGPQHQRDTIGGILATLTIPPDTGGIQQLLDWATSFGKVLAFGVDGAGSYGATLASPFRRASHKVVEAGKPAGRRLRRMNGKSDTLDAQNAARGSRRLCHRHRHRHCHRRRTAMLR